MKNVLADVAKFGAPVIAILTVLQQTIGSTPGWESVVIGALVAGGTAILSFVSQQRVAAAAATKSKG
jgi:hypothetical protein